MMNEENYTATENGEEMTLLSDTEQGAAENLTAAGTGKSKKSTAKASAAANAKPKSRRTGEGKLAALMEQQEKLTAARNAHREKGNEIDSKLSDVEGKIKEIHLKELERIRKERNFDYADIVALIGNIPDRTEFARLINDTKAQDEK